jgi:hypothetical protein
MLALDTIAAFHELCSEGPEQEAVGMLTSLSSDTVRKSQLFALPLPK